MSKIFITGSSDGLGQFTAKSLIELSHDVVLHARNSKRADDAMKNNPGAKAVLIADLSKMDETIRLAEEVNKLGPFDVIIHNAGVYEASGEEIFSVNTLAPFVLTSLIEKPKRIIYLSSGMHLHGHFKPEDFDSGNVSYSDSKLHVVMLSMAVAGKWKNVFSNAVNPG